MIGTYWKKSTDRGDDGSRSERAGGVIALVATAILVIGVAANNQRRVLEIVIVSAALLLAAGWRDPVARTLSMLALVSSACLYVLRLLPWSFPWPIPLVVTLAILFGITRLPAWGWRSTWYGLGTVNHNSVRLILAIVPVSGAALLVWYRFQYDESRDGFVVDFVRDTPLALAILGGLTFAIFNAAAEELTFNGILQTALADRFASPLPALLGALAFGAAHFNGFPSGYLGVIMATSYGLILAALRQLSGGLLAPWIAHLCADLTIFTILFIALR